jgi:hypothetical protein
MKLFSVSIGLLLATLGIFFVPISFAVDGFGLVVNPGGVRTIKAVENGVVLHFPNEGGRFHPGEFVTAVHFPEAVAKNALLEGTLLKDLAKIEADHIEKTSKNALELERERAKRDATAQRLAAREELTRNTESVVNALQSFNAESGTDIDALNEERLNQLAQLEDLVKRSGEVSALPAQRLATMMDTIQSNRLSVITSRGTRFSTDKMALDMVKQLNDLTYSNNIDRAEIGILEDRVRDLEAHNRELEQLRQNARREAEVKYLAKAQLPQVAVADGMSVDMRTLQASRADVTRNDPLRLLATRDPARGVSMIVFGEAESAEVLLSYGGTEILLRLTGSADEMKDALRQGGLPLHEVYLDRVTVGDMQLLSVFAEFDGALTGRLSVVQTAAHTAGDIPVLIRTSITTEETVRDGGDENTNEIIGFLENRHAVVLKPGQKVRGSISDTRTGSEIVFDARLLDRDYSTVDTKELGIRLGNQSLAAKIIKRGVLSQVVVGVDENSARKIDHLPGAVVHLSFPLARQSLFSFLLAKDAEI